jgi:hypothetical protein
MKHIFESKFGNCQTFELFEDNKATMPLDIYEIQLRYNKDTTYLNQQSILISLSKPLEKTFFIKAKPSINSENYWAMVEYYILICGVEKVLIKDSSEHKIVIDSWAPDLKITNDVLKSFAESSIPDCPITKVELR